MENVNGHRVPVTSTGWLGVWGEIVISVRWRLLLRKPRDKMCRSLPRRLAIQILKASDLCCFLCESIRRPVLLCLTNGQIIGLAVYAYKCDEVGVPLINSNFEPKRHNSA